MPGVLALGWMMLMKPLTLHRRLKAWEIDPRASVLRLWPALRAKHVPTRRWVGQGAIWLCLLMPGLTFALAAGLDAVGVEIRWESVAVGVAFGVAFGVAGGVAFGVAVGVAVGVAFGVAFGVAVGVAGGVALGVAGGVALGVAGGVAGDVAGGVAGGVAFGVAVGVAGGVAFGVAGGVAFGVAFGLSVIRGPFFLTALPVIPVLRRRLQQDPSRIDLLRWLPYRHDELLRFPLPGLRQLLVEIGEHHPTLAPKLIAEASETVAQGKPARRALHELQSRSLEQAAMNRLWASVAALEQPFLPNLDALPKGDPLQRFVAAAADLDAAGHRTSHREIERLLTNATRHLDPAALLAGDAPDPDHRLPRLARVAAQWRGIIANERHQLEARQSVNPEVPRVFVAGNPLDPSNDDHVALFRGRADLIRIIEHDLASEQRTPLLLTAQRRMGKSSLLSMLPRFLGDATRLAIVDFQPLSESEQAASAPHRLLTKKVAERLADLNLDLPAPPEDTDWGPSLDWLRHIDARLTTHDRRLLVAIDEVEKLQTGIEEGWATPKFLDFVRKAADSLSHIRLLLVSAWTPDQLGPTWADRLINAVHRRIGPLDLTEARALLQTPVPDFPPETFPDGIADSVLAETGGHPFLVQLLGDELVAVLNEHRRPIAQPADVEIAINRILDGKAQALFSNLFDGMTPARQAIIRRLAAGEVIPKNDPVGRGLRIDRYLEAHDDRLRLAFPLFGSWVQIYRPN